MTSIQLTQAQVDGIVAQAGGGGTAPPPPPVMDLTIGTRKLNLARLLAPDFQYAGSDRYARLQNLMVLTGPALVHFYVTNVEPGGGSAVGMSLSHPSYGVSVNGVEWSPRYNRVGTERGFAVTVTPPAGLPDNWYLGECVCYDAAGLPIAAPIDSPTMFWFGVDRNGQLAACPDLPKMTGSYPWTHPNPASVNVPATPGVCAWIRMPKAANEPQPRPLAARTLTPFATKVLYTALTRTNISPPVSQDDSEIYRTCYNDGGIASTFNLQSYFPEDWQFAAPRLSLTDGPRNVACHAPAIDIMLRHAGGFDFSDAWRRGHVDVTGATRTFYGLRHKRRRYSGHDSAQNWYDPPDLSDPNLEVVNASSWPASVPMARRFAWESWAFAWDKRTLAIDPSKPKILVGGVLTPQHATNVTGFQPCRFGRILKVTWKSNANGLNVDPQGNVTDPVTGASVDILSLPPTIVEWVTGLGDPWGLVCEDGVIAVTDRDKHRLSEYSADTPNTLIGHVIDNPHGATYGAIGPRRRFVISAVADNGPASWDAAHATAARADVMVAPEGLYTYVDAAGDRWYGWGSYAQGEVREINRRTKAWRVVCRPFVGYGAKSFFLYVKRSDGTFGAAGVVGTTTFSEAVTSAGGWGHPELFWPTAGTASDGTPLSNAVSWDWVHGTQAKVYGGPGGRTEGTGYSMAFDLGRDGRLVAGSTLSAFDEWTLTPGTPPAQDEAKISRGFAYWKAKHYYLRWGWAGYDGDPAIVGPLPWGENPDCDAYLIAAGNAP